MDAPGKRPQTARQARGQAGEDQALAHLLRHGLTLVTRNFRCKAGEIDLIMHDRDSLVFVEVRRRSSAGFGGAAASVTAAKRLRLVRAAQFYLLRQRVVPACRFDVVAIDGDRLDWLQNAFDAF